MAEGMEAMEVMVEDIMAEDIMAEDIMAEDIMVEDIMAVIMAVIMVEDMKAIMAIARVTMKATMPTMAAMHSVTMVPGIAGNTIIGAGIVGAGDGPISTVTSSHSHFGRTLLTTHSGSTGPISFSPTCSGRARVADICHRGTPGLTTFTGTAVPPIRRAIATQ
jgi:hypothetical protein